MPKALKASVATVVELPVEGAPETEVSRANGSETVAALAYELWIQRGCPLGSPEEDWYRAEAQLGIRNAAATVTASSV
jgi:hypothetical protein